MKKTLLLLLCATVTGYLNAQIPETESNGSFATANSIQQYNNIIASVGDANGDNDDYYRTILPVDGTIRVYIQATNNGTAAGSLAVNGYDRTKISPEFSVYAGGSQSIGVGVTVIDSITLRGRAADTFYFQFSSNRFFNYQFNYRILDQTTNDAEPNGSFATAVPIAASETKSGHITYQANGSTYDVDDYYRTILPADGTLKVYVKGVNRGSGGGGLYLRGYDRLKTATSIDGYITGSSAVPVGATIYDTITLNGTAADTFYFRLSTSATSRTFDYEFRYEVENQTPNDAEPNGSFATAVPIAVSETKQGHISYQANGGTYDPDDYYRAILPADGTLKVYVKGVNRGSNSGGLYLRGYDRLKAATSIDGYITGSSAVPVGATIYDTITLNGAAADTFYFRLSTSATNRTFDYEFRYEVENQTPNDAEPNGSFATAVPIAVSETKQGHISYQANGSTYDVDDYYSTVFPVDGTIKVYVKGVNRGSNIGGLFIRGYDRRKTVTSFGQYTGGTQILAPGTVVYDTITMHGMAADTFYFRLNASATNRTFDYEFRYEIIDTSLNDAGTNDSFAETTSLSGTQTRFGHTGYKFNGTSDAFDFYRTDFTVTDSLKLYLQATNYSGTTATLTLTGYNTAQAQIYSRTKSNVPAGATVYDSVKILVIAPATVYNRIGSTTNAFAYQLNINSRLPGNGFTISGPLTTCNVPAEYKAQNIVDNDITYHWTLLSGGSLSFTDSIATVTWTTPGTHILQLYLQNAYGNSVTKQIAVTVAQLSPATAPVVTANGRFLSIASLIPGATERRWFKDGVFTGITDSLYYAATAGNYTAKFANQCGEGPASAIIAFNAPQVQTISFPAVIPIGYSPDSFRILPATASSGLPVSYRIISGPGVLQGDSLFVTAAGSVIVEALQNGNTNYGAATPVQQTIMVVGGPQTITFDAIPNKIYGDDDFAPAAFASSGLPVTFSVVSGPATISGNRVKINGAGIIEIRASQTGNANYAAAVPVSRQLCVGLRSIDTIKGPRITCPVTLQYTTKRIPGAVYEWSVSGGGILTASNDTATVQWQTPGTHTITVNAYSACDPVRSAPQTLAVTVLAAYNTGAVGGLIPANNATGLALPVSLSWSPVTNATSYDLYVWPSGYAEPALPLDSGLVQVTYNLNENIALNTAYNWRVVAKNVCSSSQSAIQQFTATINSTAKPDLVLDSLSHPVSLYQSMPLTVSWRVKNDGQNSTGAATWKDRIYLSPVNSVRPGDGSVLLGAYHNPSYLLPGETYTQTKTVTVPAGISGQWYLYVLTDNEQAFCFGPSCEVFWSPYRYNHGENKVVEKMEYNNYRYSVVNVLDGPLPDLQLTSVGAPAAAFGGSTINVSYTVKNEGDIAAAGLVKPGCPQRGWRDRFFISSDSSFNISNAFELTDTLVRFLKPGTVSCTSESLPYADFLLPDSSYTIQYLLQLPYNYFGKQYIYVYTNGFNDAYEGPFNTNNIRRSDSINITVAPPADLVVTMVQPPSGALSGKPVTISFAVTNQGANPPYEQSWKDSVFITTTPVFSYNSIIARGQVSRNRPASFSNGMSYNGTINLTIPDSITGTCYVFVKTDARNEVFEFNQELNNLTTGTAFTVLLNPPVDLVVTSIIAPDTVSAGVPFAVTYTLKNNGAGTVATSWSDRVYADANPAADENGLLLATVAHNGNDSIIAGGEKTFIRQVSVSPSSGISGSAVYLKIYADAGESIYEHLQENNNIGVSTAPTGGGTVFIKPAPGDTIDRRANLQTITAAAPATFTANTNITVNWTVKNIGPLTTTRTYWQDRVYLSSDTIPGSGDTELKRVAVDGYSNTGLGKDSLYNRSAQVAIPLNVSGNYYLLFLADATKRVTNDSTDDDNLFKLPVTILQPPVPDLVITPQNNLPDSVWGGSVFWLYYSVQNIGSVAASGFWYDKVSVSAQQAPGNPVGYKAQQRTLAPGQSYTDSLLVEVPVYISGEKYVVLYADGSDHIFEGAGGNTNNISARFSNVYPFNTRPAPDLIVSAVSVPDSVKLGKNITASFSITNQGTRPASGNNANAFYLSGNPVFESNNDLLTASAETANTFIAAGQTIHTSITGKAIPPATGANYGILRTNVRNTIFEGNLINNNTGISSTSTYIDAVPLTLGQAKADTLRPDEAGYYKVTVGAGLDLLVSLSSNYTGGGSNALQVAYNRVPGDASFDASGFNPAAINQQALLSGTTAGTYYIKAQSHGIAVDEPVTLLVNTIPFSIINATPSLAGNGTVNGMIFGGGFKSTTQILLRRNGTDYPAGAVIRFVNSTQLEMQWKLSGLPIGVYDVVAVNPGNIETILPAAFTIEPERGYDLEYTPVMPSGIRPWGAVFTYKGKNRGNVNIDVLQGDITMIEKNATVLSVSTTGRVRRYSKYAPQYDSLMTEDWYISGKTRVVPFIVRNLLPGEEFSVTVTVRFKNSNIVKDQKGLMPLQCRMFGYSNQDFVRDQVRNFEMMRLVLINHPRASLFPNSQMLKDGRSGSKVFGEKMMAEYVTAGLMNWTDTIGTNLRWDCSRCLQLLPEVKPLDNAPDSFTFSPKKRNIVGTDTLGTGQVFGPNQRMLLEMNKGLYWWYHGGEGGAPGQPGQEEGWDMLRINGTLHISATSAQPFKILPSSLWKSPIAGGNIESKLPGWSPAYDTSYLIVVATGGITGYDSSKISVNPIYFAQFNPLRNGYFTTALRSGQGSGPDSLMLVWKAYKPGAGEPGVDGVDGGPGQPGSPGGRGGDGNAQRRKGGKGGRGGRGGDQISVVEGLNLFAQPGGRGGRGGDGYGDGGDGGDSGESGLTLDGDGVCGVPGGEAGNGGTNGGHGGKGGRGGDGGESAANGEGGCGGEGGKGGTGSGSAFGGRGGDGGNGGKGGADCGGGRKGGEGGDGGVGGSGPLGNGAYGASGRKGIGGPPAICPPCTDSKVKGQADYSEVSNNIDYAKAVWGAVDGFGDDSFLSLRGIGIEILNQSTNEYSPGANLVVSLADAAIDVLIAGSTAEYQVAMKVAVTSLKVSDYLASKILSREDYEEIKPVMNFLIKTGTILSSPTDFFAEALKFLAEADGMFSVLSMETPCDPNEIAGPAGYGDEKFVSVNAVLPYTIHFENDSLAEVPAQRVLVRQPLSLKADPLTFRLGNFGFGPYTFTVPENSTNYTTTLSFDSLGYRINVTAGVDIVNREAFWILQAVDPQTGLPPSNAFTGFLPPDDSLSNGKGFVTYSIKPMVTALTGDSITAKASIIFDENTPIETNTWVNIVDAFPPVSAIGNLPDSTPDRAIVIQYTGNDDNRGAGIRSYRMYVSDNGATPVLLLDKPMPVADTTIIGEPGHTYYFYAQAVDNTGNTEILLLVDSVKIIEGQETICPGSNLVLNANLNGALKQWQVNTGSGYVNISDGAVYSGSATTTLTLTNPPTSMYGYRFRCVVNGNQYSREFLLKFGMNWEGSVSTAWENAANWSCGVLPDANTDVTVNGGKANYPEISSNVTIRTLRLNPGAAGTVKSGYTLTLLK